MTGTEVSRERFVGAGPEEVEAFLSAAYTTASIRRTRAGAPLWFRHDTIAAPAAGFAINHVVCTPSFHTTLPADRPPAPLTAGYLHRGRVSWSGAGHDEARVARAGAVLPPTAGRAHATVEPVELVAAVLDPDRVADYAAHACGSVAAPMFTAMTPISPGLAGHWRDVLSYVRDDLLANPAATASPIVLQSAFRLLAAALLSVFPNTALALATDPHRPDPAGGPRTVADADLDEVVGYLHAHAGDPVGPGEIATVADAPYREVVAGLGRRRDTSPARELWRSRLRGVRGDLLGTDHPGPGAGGRVIAETAARWGFGNVAVFTTAYTTATGETPEDTLRR